MTPKNLYAARHALVSAKLNHSTAIETERIMRAKCEMAIIQAAGGEKALGANEAERKRVLTVKLDESETYQHVMQQLRRAENDLLYAEMELDHLLDERRAEEWAIRARLADALQGRDTNPAQPEEAAFDYAGDTAIGRVAAHPAYAVDEDLPF